ncbi:MAG TPA: hypothetical protein VFQ00_01410 [Terriglobales bacterium]|nr:hypothetical protein [Terriglobales bacterium]
MCVLIVLLLGVDVILVIRDFFRPGTRGRAGVAALLWLPVFFLFGMIQVWEGPVFVEAAGDPPVFQIRGLAGVCGVDVFGPEQENAEWMDDEIGLLWSINHAARFPVEVEFKYGGVPSGFVQIVPAGRTTAAPLHLNTTYKLVLDRCMGGPQTVSLHDGTISEYRPSPAACWGQLRVPERQKPAYVRVDCKTHEPLPMSKRGAERLKAYRENRIATY